MTINELAQVYDQKFRPLNMDFKKIATDWQMKQLPSGENVLNDHADAEYDTRVLGSLFELHKKVMGLSGELVPLHSEAKRYLKRLEEAIKKINGGDRRYVTGVTVDSYHTVWYGFHNDILKKLGREERLSEDEV
jgi:sugar phosphate isomerase/epimerase